MQPSIQVLLAELNNIVKKLQQVRYHLVVLDQHRRSGIATQQTMWIKLANQHRTLQSSKLYLKSVLRAAFVAELEREILAFPTD